MKKSKIIDEQYFTFSKAKRLLSIRPETLSDNKLQKHIVLLRDFERYTNNTSLYGDILIKGGYFKSATTQASKGVSPKDIWMAHNLVTALDGALEEKKKRLKEHFYKENKMKKENIFIENKFVVSAKVKTKGNARNIISKPLDKKGAEKFVKQVNDDMKKSIPDYKVFSNLKIEPLKEQKLSKLQLAYREFFKALMGEFGVKSPVQLGDKRSEFFNRIKKEWPKAKSQIKEGVLRQTIRKMIYEALTEGVERYDVYGYKKITNKLQDYDKIIKASSLDDAKKQLEKIANDNSLEYIELYRKNSYLGSAGRNKKFSKIKRNKTESLANPQVAQFPIETGGKTTHHATGDQISGGRGDDLSGDDVDAEELAVGIAVEIEHTDDPELAREIALDHLSEKNNYYSKLIASGIVDEPEAIELAKKYGWLNEK